MSDQVAPQSTPLSALADKNFRVRRLSIVADIDVYDADGFLIDRGPTNQIVIPEVAFTPELISFLTKATDLGRGFVARPAPKLHAVGAPAPDVTA